MVNTQSINKVLKMNKLIDFTSIRQNFDSTLLAQMIEGFTVALIWQDEELDQYSDKKVSYHAKEKIENVCRTFYTFCLSDDILLNELVNHDGGSTGHNLALQMLGHGVVFWENENTKLLDQLLALLLDKKVVKPFRLFYCDQWDHLEWDSI
ncbi:hypothetical protein HWD03_gp101 [Alteromonas phage vB_AmeM_PT11-V22]|uniref:Uncharacterized protein n=1 Tax=Alteromonas phage vB_AmeM_PT11-V22 TaxID=2704031 RepID=A0A6C0R0I8_9CAUD|nr:hypothetical protein HWD03_gp101 [Alteromonas phage vB_AmeM_PT11-V22]QHZ59781.1 hypothetical protein [Alteromonas phage vB_AmeM_PT11-V22]